MGRGVSKEGAPPWLAIAAPHNNMIWSTQNLQKTRSITLRSKTSPNYVPNYVHAYFLCILSCNSVARDKPHIARCSEDHTPADQQTCNTSNTPYDLDLKT